jgi:hypothetical protein
MREVFEIDREHLLAEGEPTWPYAVCHTVMQFVIKTEISLDLMLEKKFTCSRTTILHYITKEGPMLASSPLSNIINSSLGNFAHHDPLFACIFHTSDFLVPSSPYPS